MEKLLKLLNMPMQMNIEDGYEQEFYSYDEFTNVYNTLERTNIVTKNSPQSFLNESKCHVEFDGDDFFVYLDGDFNVDNYRLKILKGFNN